MSRAPRFMWNHFRNLFKRSEQEHLSIISHDQEDCDVPFEKITEVVKWLGLSLMSAGYRSTAHIIWDSAASEVKVNKTAKQGMRKNEPVFLYRCGDRPTPPPASYYWRLMPEYPDLRIYQLERRAK